MLNDRRYPRLVRRVQAVLIDSLIVAVLFVGAVLLVGALAVEPVPLRVALMTMPAALYEPLLVWLSGSTLGHRLRGLVVFRAGSPRYPSLLQALFRYLIKLSTGGFSMIFVLLTKRHQGIHDLAANTVLVLRHPASLAAGETQRERPDEELGSRSIPMGRRLLVILVYIVAFVAVHSAVKLLACGGNVRCSLLMQSFAPVVELLWLVVVGTIVVFGWRGRLYGARDRHAPGAGNIATD